MLSVYQAEGNNNCKEELYNGSRMCTWVHRLPPPSQCIPTGAKKKKKKKKKNPEIPKSRGGTLVLTCAYIRESTYSWIIAPAGISPRGAKYTVSMPEKISIFLNRGREESVGNDNVSIVCARKYEMVRIT